VQAANAQNVPYNIPSWQELRPNARAGVSTNYQVPVSPSLEILGNFLNRIFPGALAATRPFTTRGAGSYRSPTDLTEDADPHLAGRAIDLFIPTIRVGRVSGLPDLTRGSPVANYLVRYARELGIQLIVWARSAYLPENRTKFTHYTKRQDESRFDHSDHLHVELTPQAALLDTDDARAKYPFYASGGAEGAPPAPGGPNVTETTPTSDPNQAQSSVTNPAETALPGTEQGTATTTTTTQAPNTTPTANAQEERKSEDKFQDLFRLYAQYEYLRQRYTARQAAVQMRFNPYLVPGFPSMLFDSMRTRFHMVGYIQSISHSAQAGGGGGISTSVQLTCCRTLPEFINDVRSDSQRFSGRIMAAPAEIIDEIRLRIQDEANAELFYRKLFYGDGPRPGNVPVAFRWDLAMGYAQGLEVQPFVNEGETISEQADRQEQTAATISQLNRMTGPNASGETQALAGEIRAELQAFTPVNRQNLNPNLELSPRENIYQDAFDRYDIAMQLAARPACTLTQYIRFWHGGRTVNDLILNRIVSGAQQIFSYAEVMEEDVVAVVTSRTGRPENIRDMSSRKSSVYYDRIFKLRPGPGVGPNLLQQPGVAERGYTDPPNVQPSPTHAGVPGAYPQTRADWDLALEQYRDKVRQILRPST
jgi:hypothetical protein